MNIPVIVDVAIGLIFIYLILSLLASEILELIATVLQWRAQHLRQSIINLLAGDTITDQNIEAAKRLTKDLYNHPLLNDLNQEARGLFSTLFRKITWLCSWGYQKLTDGEGVFGNKVTAPSYIPGETFATALIERLGIAKLAETLIEVKFNRFRDSIIKNIGIILERSDAPLELPALEAGLKTRPSDSYEALQVDLYQICQQLSKRELTLITAIDKISLEIEQFINQLKNEQLKNDDSKQLEEQNKKIEEQNKKLALWKQTLFGKQNELAIVNGGLKPTLEEVADLVNTTSKTCQLFKKGFQTYYKQRYNQVVDELQEFLLLLDSSIRIIINREENHFISKEAILDKSGEYSSIRDTNSTEPKIGISLSRVDDEIIKVIDNRIAQSDKKSKDNLNAFRIGFAEQGLKLIKSKVFTRQEAILVGFIVLSLIVIIVAFFPLRKFTIRPVGATVWAVILFVIFLFFQWLYNKKPSFRVKTTSGNNENSYITGSILNSVDVFFSSKIEDKAKIEDFQKKFKNDFNNLYLTNNQSLIQWELTRLGQSFRQYHRALVLNNADVDLPFVPSSVKQSVASLVRRSKTKIARTGNEVEYLRKEIEIWFDRSMDRSSGVYQRNVRGIAILIGFLLAIVTNTNSIYILNRLAHDQELRQVVEKSAEQFIQGSQPSPSAPPTSLSEKDLRDRNQIVSQLLNEQLTLPIGWNPRVLGRQFDCEFPKNARDDDWEKLFDKCLYADSPNFDEIYNKVPRVNNDTPDSIYKKAQAEYKKYRGEPNQRNKPKPKHYFFPTAILVMILTSGKWFVGVLFLVGWFATAIAISMGASFWFDLLGKLINVRNTGNRPPSSANQTSVNSEKSS